MLGDWRIFCKAKDMQLESDVVRVIFKDERSQKVKVMELEDHILLVSTVARRAVLNAISDPELYAWIRNRASSLVGYRVDSSGRLIGECWVPKVGLDADELQFLIRKLATDCDRMEHLITGVDVE